jgi:hypothetical protein
MEQTIESVAKIAQEEIDREVAGDKTIRKAIDIVKKFIQTNRVICYGGTAINNLLPKEDQFYDFEKDIPDYDFFSENPQIHAMNLADQLTRAGYKSVEVKPGIHLGTFKVFCDYTGVADISHLDKPIFEKLFKSAIKKGNVYYAPPNFLRMAMYLELSRPKGDVSRWTKVYKRLTLLNKHHPMTCPARYKKVTDVHLLPEVKSKLEKILIAEDVIVLGFNGYMLQKSVFTKEWMFPLDLLVVPEKREEVVDKIISSFQTRVKVKEFEPYGELFPSHTDIVDSKSNKLIVRVYETSACHSYHRASNGLMIASIPTLLQFFLSALYADKHFLQDMPEQRFICVAQQLVEMANDNVKKRYKLLTPITCLGKQKGLLDMKLDKSQLYEKLSQNKSSPEFLEYFFTYIPTSMGHTKRRQIRELLNKTFKRR